MIEFLTALVGIAVFYKVWVSWYFKSKEFQAIKNSIAEHAQDCNDLNNHIENLKSTPFDMSHLDRGSGVLSDVSDYKMKRRKWAEEDKEVSV
jgi:hypothetical protein